MGQIASCQYIGSFPRAQYAPPGGGGKRTLARKRVSLPSRLPKLKSNSHWVRVCARVTVGMRSRVGVTVGMRSCVAVGVGICHGLTSSSFRFGKFLFGVHSQAEKMRDTKRGREIYSPWVIVLLKTTSSHRVYLSHLSKPPTALCSKSHFGKADYSVCSINFSLHLSQEQPL